jgi:aspartate ammonia-lyase
VPVPADALFGAQTVRTLANSGTSGPRLGERGDLVRALAQTKVAAARANAELGELDPEIAEAIVAAGREVAAGSWLEHFPIALVHGGGGTPANMNVNEVLANRAGEILGGVRGTYDRVHPLDHVNRSQSSNDVHPTAVHCAALRRGAETVEALEGVAAALLEKAEETRGVERLGRTCLQDALPVDVADGHAAQATAVSRTSQGVASALERLLEVPLGATAVGTGAGAPAGYRELAVGYLAEETGLPLRPSADPFDALAHIDPLASLASAIARAALVLGKIAADARLLASGPVGGLGELRLPAVQVGSSLMPGKVNPVIPELVLQVSYDVRGSAATVEHACAGGELELNVMTPVVARRLLESLETLSEAARLLADRCIAGLEWDEDVLRRHRAGSRAGLLELAREQGYDSASRSASRARRGKGT